MLASKLMYDEKYVGQHTPKSFFSKALAPINPSSVQGFAYFLGVSSVQRHSHGYWIVNIQYSLRMPFCNLFKDDSSNFLFSSC